MEVAVFQLVCRFSTYEQKKQNLFIVVDFSVKKGGSESTLFPILKNITKAYMEGEYFIYRFIHIEFKSNLIFHRNQIFAEVVFLLVAVWMNK